MSATGDDTSLLGQDGETVESLLQEVRLLRAIIDSSPDQIYAKDLNGKFLVVNRAVSTLMGAASPQDVIGKTDFDFFPTDLAAQYWADEQQLILSDHPVIGKEEEVVDSVSGERKWNSTTKLPLRDANGNAVGLFGINRDITARKRALEKVEAQNEYVRKLTDNVPGMIYQILFHADGRVSYPFVSSGCRDLYGVEPEAVMQDASLLTKLWHPDDVGEYNRRVEVSRLTLLPFVMECRIVLPDGQLRWLKVHSKPERLPDGGLLFSGVRVDVTDRKLFEEQLKASDDRFKQLTANVPGMLYQYVLEPGGKAYFSYASDQIRNLFELEPDILLTHPRAMLEALHPEDAVSFHASIQMSAQSLQPHRWQGRLLVGGKPKWIESSATPRPAANGRIIWDGILIDITNRKRVEEALQESRERYELSVQGSQSGLWDWNLITNQVYFSPLWKEMLGYAEHEVEDSFETISTLTHPDDIMRVTQAIDDYLAGRNETYTVEFRMRHKDGSYRWIQTKGVCLRNADGLPYRMAGSHIDITAQKEFEQEINDSREFLTGILNAVPDPILVKDEKYRWILFNTALAALLGKRQSDLLGKTDRDVMTPTQAEWAIQKDAALLASGGATEYEEWLTTAMGERLVATKKTRFADTSGRHFLIGVTRDITDARAAEVERESLYTELASRLKEIQETQSHLIQSEKMSSLGQMVAGIAHELNTPIGYVSSNVQLAQQRFHNLAQMLHTCLTVFNDIYEGQHEIAFGKMQQVTSAPNGSPSELSETVQRTDRLFTGMGAGLEQMSSLVRSMRNFSRLDEAEMKKADLREGLRGCLLMIGHALKDHDVKVSTDYGEIPEVDCYPAQLNQVFINLIQNAIHAVEHKEDGHVHLSTALIDNTVVVRVQDNGNGIPKHVQPKIFDPFFTTKPVGKGTGLGLSICYNIIQKHHGTLSFETAEGVGTTFIVSIPVTDFLPVQQ